MKSASKTLALFITALLMITTVFAVDAKDKFKNTHVNTGNQAEDIINVAKTQIGFREGENNETKYGTWYGLPNQPWCAMFVSWCARQAGVPMDILSNCAIAAPDPGYFDIKYFDGKDYTPEQGDLFFTKKFTHVGLVDYAEGDYFYTVEGNTNDSGSDQGIGVFSLKRTTADYYFGVPDYNYRSRNHICNKAIQVQTFDEHPHYSEYICSYCENQYTDESLRGYNPDCALCQSEDINLLGDVNADKIVNIRDATYIQKHLADIEVIPDDCFLLCDVNTDGLLTIKDATCIRKYIAGIETDIMLGLPIY